MKTLLCFVCLLIPVNVSAMDGRVATLATMAVIDYNQSCKMFYGANSANHYELNPVLGRKPSRNDLLAFGVAGVGSVYLLDVIMDDSTFKNVLLDSILATEKMNIEWNKQVSETGRRPFNTIMFVMSFEI